MSHIPASSQAISSQAIEQIMRLSDDEALAAVIASVQPGSPAAYAAIGRLPPAVTRSLVPGCPILALADPILYIQPTWRCCYPAQPGSLFETLEFFRSVLQPDSSAPDPYVELIDLRDQVDPAHNGPMLKPSSAVGPSGTSPTGPGH